MTETVVSSASKEVVIGFERPFVVIGERINPTGRKILAAEMADNPVNRMGNSDCNLPSYASRGSQFCGRCLTSRCWATASKTT